MSRVISVVGGSVQLRLEISGKQYVVDVWKEGERWQWTATAKLKNSRLIVQGNRPKWSEARTAAFRECIRFSKEN